MFMIKLGFDLYLVVIWYLTSGLLVIRDISSLQVKMYSTLLYHIGSPQLRTTYKSAQARKKKASILKG